MLTSCQLQSRKTRSYSRESFPAVMNLFTRSETVKHSRDNSRRSNETTSCVLINHILSDRFSRSVKLAGWSQSVRFSFGPAASAGRWRAAKHQCCSAVGASWVWGSCCNNTLMYVKFTQMRTRLCCLYAASSCNGLTDEEGLLLTVWLPTRGETLSFNLHHV